MSEACGAARRRAVRRKPALGIVGQHRVVPSAADTPDPLCDHSRGRDDRDRNDLLRAAPAGAEGGGSGHRSDRSARDRHGGLPAAVAARADPSGPRAGRQDQGRHRRARGRQSGPCDPAFRRRSARPDPYGHDHAARGRRDPRADERQGADGRRPAECHDRRDARPTDRRQPAGAGAGVLWRHARQYAPCRAAER